MVNMHMRLIQFMPVWHGAMGHNMMWKIRMMIEVVCMGVVLITGCVTLVAISWTTSLVSCL